MSIRRIGLAVGLSVAVFLPTSANAESSRPARPSSLLTLGGAFTVEAVGCERNVRTFRVSTARPIDVTKVEKGQIVSGVYLRQRDRSGRSGWRNVSVAPDGLAVDFELFAEGAGHYTNVPSQVRQCVEAAPARVVVDVEAWVLDP
jgi:hypothetical protein